VLAAIADYMSTVDISPAHIFKTTPRQRETLAKLDKGWLVQEGPNA
jgi:hypothetical protein